MAHGLDGLLTEQINHCTAGIDALPVEAALRLMNNEDQLVAAAVEREIPVIAAAVEKITAALRAGGRLIYIGAGTSGRLGVLDAAECPPTFSTRPGLVIGLIAGGESALVRSVEGAEDGAGSVDQLRQIQLSDRDAVVGITASGRTPYVIAGLEYAQAAGAVTVAISCTPAPAVGEVAQIMITPLVGPEVIAGSTRLKAGTATKMVLNMLSTAVMVQLGKVYGNLMVDVQATNGKLVDRARRIVAAAAGVPPAIAVQALEQAGNNPKVAIVMLGRNCLATEAERLLAEAGGFIGRAITMNGKESEG